MEKRRMMYPRPELVREKWLNLNGEWDFEFDFGNNCTYIGDHCNLQDVHYRNKEFMQKDFSKKILVPFCPESELSGIGYKDFIGGCWYKKSINIPNDWKGRILLNFEAAYYETLVFIGDDLVCKHNGGYTPFSVDITNYIKDYKVTILVHCAGDPRNIHQPSGKQSIRFDSHGCFYTRTTGIWQTVWLECVPDVYLTKLFLTPDVDNKKIDVKMFFNNVANKKIKLLSKYNNEVVGEIEVSSTSKCVTTSIQLSKLELWEVRNGKLYDLNIEIESNGNTDRVSSYFGMRKIDIDEKGMLINDKRVMQKLVLDQGFYPDGIYTASDESCFKKDIELALSVGFNGARLHQKVFERRFLYECDKAGYIVWGEYPSWNFDYTSRDALLNFLPEWMESVERDYNHPSIVVWCPLNENYPFNNKIQCDDFVKQLYIETKRFDSSRAVLDTSWFTHVKTDFFDTHDYTQDVEIFKKNYTKWEDDNIFDDYDQQYIPAPFILSEYGGFQWPVKEGGWGYGVAPKNEKEFEERFVSFAKIIMNNPKICGLCYTQLYDVEIEQNGIFYYDRTKKFDDSMIKRFKEVLSSRSEYEKLK